MRVNVIYSGKGKNDILDRMANSLARANGWDYNEGPSPKADINHFICYIEYAEKFTDWRFTPVSAWFTHQEPNREWKAFWWELAASNADLRIITAPEYMDNLSTYGPTALVRPCVDSQFEIKERVNQEIPRIGVSGFVHPGGRKGEKLVARLAGSDLGRTIDLQATGRGWPCPTKLIDWEALPAWYNSLDLYLCTSTIEGIPAPPLEALACGIPVVIPEGVGMLDRLPDQQGITRYAKGDYGQMMGAIRENLAGRPYDRKTLRDSVSQFNLESWGQDHLQAFLDLRAGVHVESDRHGERGVIYVAYGDPSRRCAEAAISSFHDKMPGIPVGLISTEPGLGEDLFIYCDDVDIGGRFAKTKIYDLAPREWQYVLYLDSDTQVIDDISFLYNVLLDGWDMVICKNPAKYHLAREMKRSDNHDECNYTFEKIGTSELIQLNGGVFAFQRNQRTHAFFEAWHREWAKWGKRDQGALLRALFEHPLRIYVLGNEWNTITRYQSRKESAGILHWPMVARRWRGKVIQRSDSPRAWEIVRKWEQENSGKEIKIPHDVGG